MAESSPDSAAWILALDGQLRAAVGERELVHLIEVPTLLNVPFCPYYCRHVLIWNDTVLPAMDLAAKLQGQSLQRSRTLAGVFAYQTRRGADPEYGALLLAGIPARVRVTNALACALPKKPRDWHTMAISCFKQGDDVIPILDLPHIFAGGLL
jgi:chemotaxis signal transduction protein